MRLPARLLTFVACACVAQVGWGAPRQRPNVIIVLSDDQGYGDFSCHGNPKLRTPHLDRLHDESIRLADFHVAPMCTPTRGQLMTGLDALRNGATSVCAGRSFIRRASPGADGDPTSAAAGSPSTMAEWFARQGYRTALFGKWHLGDSYPNLPEQRGFGDAVYHLGWGITSMADLWRNDYFNGRFRHDGHLNEYPGYCTDVWFKLAKDWIKERNAADEPFFLYLPTNAPHGPLWVADQYRQPYLEQGLKRPLASFFGMIANLDENMGQLDQLLADLKLRDNTILIYFHDNGGTAGVSFYNAGMRGAKTTYYEGGHRAACFLRWPGGDWKSPCDVEQLTQVQDLLPTLIETCDLGEPKTPGDGRSLAPLLRAGRAAGKPRAGDAAEEAPAQQAVAKNVPAQADATQDDAARAFDDRKLVVQYGQKPEKWQSAVLWRKWRLVHGAELYDLRSDPAQKHDVARQQPEVLAALRADRAGERPSEPRDADSRRLGQCVLRQHARPPRRQAGQRSLACAVRTPRNVRSVVAALAARGGRRDDGRRAGIPRDRWHAAGRQGAGDRERAHESRRFRSNAAGSRQTTTMQSWCLDAQGSELCGAYFAYVRRK
jgi:arylsulfatase